MFDELKDLISDAINDLEAGDFVDDVELIVDNYNESECKKMFERLAIVAVDAIQREME